jgi:glycosyltransferase involved in cell wall biosynthesis
MDLLAADNAEAFELMRVERMADPTVAIVHYTAPPIVGGVETVIDAHVRQLLKAGFKVAVIAGRGTASALPAGAAFISIPKIDSLHPRIAAMSTALEQGRVPADFTTLARQIAETLAPILNRFDHVIVHNVFTKHFNLPLTAALYDLLDTHVIRQCIAWCHDFTWTSPHSRSKVHPGYPWDLLRTYRPDVTYVVVSDERQRALTQLFNCPPEMIHVVYNGVDPDVLWGLSPDGRALLDRLDVLNGDVIMLMPVRITPAKNIELALRVVAALKVRGCETRLVITGPPDPHDAQSMDYYRSLQTLRAQLEVEHEAHFVYEAGPNPEQPGIIDDHRVAELYRVSDVLFMPSHREGFGMPVLEAGLVSMPVVCAPVPAAQEIGGEDVLSFRPDDSPESVADLIMKWTTHSAAHRLRRRVRQNYIWPVIFQREMVPLLASVREAT